MGEGGGGYGKGSVDENLNLVPRHRNLEFRSYDVRQNKPPPLLSISIQSLSIDVFETRMAASYVFFSLVLVTKFSSLSFSIKMLKQRLFN